MLERIDVPHILAAGETYTATKSVVAELKAMRVRLGSTMPANGEYRELVAILERAEGEAQEIAAGAKAHMEKVSGTQREIDRRFDDLAAIERAVARVIPGAGDMTDADGLGADPAPGAAEAKREQEEDIPF